MNGLSSLDESCQEYSLAPTDDLVRYGGQKVTAGHRDSKGITSTLGVEVWD